MKNNHVYSELAGCHACPLCLHRKRVALPTSTAMLTSRYMVVGTFPSHTEDEAGQAWVDSTRRLLLENLLEVVGLDAAQIYKTYMIKCIPSPPDNFPSGVEAETCPTWLTYEVFVNKPLVVIVFGEQPVEFFLGSRFVRYGIAHVASDARYSWFNLVTRKYVEAGHKVILRRTFPERHEGPLVVPFYDIDVIKQSSRKAIAKQVKTLKQVVALAQDIPVTWTAAMMRATTK